MSGGGRGPAVTQEQALSTIGGRIPTMWLGIWVVAIAIGAEKMFFDRSIEVLVARRVGVPCVRRRKSDGRQ